MAMATQLPLRRFRVPAVVIALAVLGMGLWTFIDRDRPVKGSELGSLADTKSPAAPARVEVVHPSSGGLQRTCIQPGSVEPFKAADLYAKASGYLKEQSVDIGSHVKEGQILARISVPEYETQVQRDKARVRDANAKVKQMAAHLKAAQAEARAADAAIQFAKVLVQSKTAFRKYREKQLKRIKELVAKNALDERTRDEQEDYYASAFEAENAANEAVNSALEKASAAHAKITQAEADLDEANAEVAVAVEELAKSNVLLDYTVIHSPYSGVITKRTFHVGDFIKSADQGGTTPMLAVEMTDVMRVVVQVPDRDVPYIHEGEPASVEIDSLPGTIFDSHGDRKIEVSRWADAEDPSTRTMRTEVDVPNPDGKLRHGMYGRVTLKLGSGMPNALRIPSGCLFGKAERGWGVVRVVKGNKVKLTPVRYTIDNGLETEIIEGLSKDDLVIARATGPLEDGSAVVVIDGKASGGH